MIVRLLILEAHEGYKVCVLAPQSPVRSWIKVYESKAHCLTELSYIQVASPDEIAEALETDLDDNIAMLVLESDVDPAVLRSAGFAEQVLGYVN